MERRTFLGSVGVAVGGLLGLGATAANEKPKPSMQHIIAGQVRVNGPCPCCCEAVFQVTAFVSVEMCAVEDETARVRLAGPVRMICEPCGCDISDADVKSASTGIQCT